VSTAVDARSRLASLVSEADPHTPIPAPLAPPKAWFTDLPDWWDPNGAPVQIDLESGRVAALVAPYGECILDGRSGCWTPPESRTNYEYAHVGHLITAEGEKVRTANVGGGIDHFDTSLVAAHSLAADHYANTATRRMVGRYRDHPPYGIMFLGSVYPGTTFVQAFEAMTSALSGDWRWIESLRDMEMVGSQLVNNPGFRRNPLRAYTAGLAVLPTRFEVSFAFERVGARVAAASCAETDRIVSMPRLRLDRARVAAALSGQLDRLERGMASVVADIGYDLDFDDEDDAEGVDLRGELPGYEQDECRFCRGEGCEKCGWVGYTGDDAAVVAAAVAAMYGDAPEARVASAKRPRDGDGDGFVFDGKPNMRPFNPLTDLVGKAVRKSTVKGAARGNKRDVAKIRKQVEKNRQIEKKAKVKQDLDRLTEATLGERPANPRERREWDRAALVVRDAVSARPAEPRRMADAIRSGRAESDQPEVPGDRKPLPRTKLKQKPRLIEDERDAFADPEKKLLRLETEGGMEWDRVKGRWVPAEKLGQPDPEAQEAYRERIRAQMASVAGFDNPTQRARDLEDVLGDAHESPLATHVVHNSRGESGEGWTAERRGLHARILNDVFDQIEAAKIPRGKRAVVLGGLPGAGKSSALKPGEAADGLNVRAFELGSKIDPDVEYTHIAINPDWFKERLSELYLAGDTRILPDLEGLKPMELASHMHEESSHLGKVMRDVLLERDFNVAFDGTLGNEKSIRKTVRLLDEAGYPKPDGLFVDISPEESAQSAADRYARASGTEMGGRFVPRAAIGDSTSRMGNKSLNRDIFNQMVAEGAFGDGITVDNTGVSRQQPRKKVTGRFENGQWTEYDGMKDPALGPNGYPARTVSRALRMPGVSRGAGTKERPFVVSDVNTAAALLAEGEYHVELVRPDEVGTLIDRLAQLALEAEKAGRGAPKIDLCRVSVPGTNLFCAENRGYPRLAMPQLTTMEPVPGSPASRMERNEFGEVDLVRPFLREMESRGIKVTEAEIPADRLKATQAELNGVKVAAGVKRKRKQQASGSAPGKPRRIIVTSDGYIVDGHHGWAADVAIQYGSGSAVKVPVYQINAPITAVLPAAQQWTAQMGSPTQGVNSAPPAAPPVPAP